MKQESYKVCVRTDSYNRIIAVNSSAFVSLDWGRKIDEGIEYKYHHAQGNYFEGGLYTDDGIPRYKLVDGQPVERTEEEIRADRDALPATSKSQEERIADLETGAGDLSEALDMLLTGVTE